MTNQPVIIVTGASQGLGAAIAWLTLHAPVAFNGKFFDYDDPRISRLSVEAFGERLDQPRM